MSRAIFMLLVAVATLFCVVTSQPRCPPSQEWTTCGSACPPKCSDPPLRFCTLQCVRGCFCKYGLVLDDLGNCIPPQFCYRTLSFIRNNF